MKAHPFESLTYYCVGQNGTEELNSLSALMFVTQTYVTSI